MHRMGWRLSKRLAHYPFVSEALKPLERSGVRLTYEAHERFLDNPRSRRLFVDDAPVLDETQTRIVNDLARDGIAVVAFSDLVPDSGAWRTLSVDAARFIEESEARLRNEAESGRSQLRKKHILRRHPLGVELSLDEPWLAFGISTRMLDVVNSYLGMYSKCLYVDQWYTPAGGPEEERVSSQRWHRDYTDKHLVKVFIYLSNVDEGGGPFEYVPGSVGGGRYGDLWPWRPLSDTYPPDEAFNRAVPASAALTCLGPPGTMIFCNTSGFHRGGFAKTTPRPVAVYNYASPASLNSLAQRNFRIAGADVPADLPRSVRFALS